MDGLNKYDSAALLEYLAMRVDDGADDEVKAHAVDKFVQQRVAKHTRVV